MSASSVSVDPKKVEAVMIWERQKSVFEIHSFLGLTGYYMRFIEDFSLSYTDDEIDPEVGSRSSLSGMTCVIRHSRN